MELEQDPEKLSFTLRQVLGQIKVTFLLCVCLPSLNTPFPFDVHFTIILCLTHGSGTSQLLAFPGACGGDTCT